MSAHNFESLLNFQRAKNTGNTWENSLDVLKTKLYRFSSGETFRELCLLMRRRFAPRDFKFFLLSFIYERVTSLENKRVRHWNHKFLFRIDEEQKVPPGRTTARRWNYLSLFRCFQSMMLTKQTGFNFFSFSIQLVALENILSGELILKLKK